MNKKQDGITYNIVQPKFVPLHINILQKKKKRYTTENLLHIVYNGKGKILFQPMWLRDFPFNIALHNKFCYVSKRDEKNNAVQKRKKKNTEYKKKK